MKIFFSTIKHSMATIAMMIVATMVSFSFISCDDDDNTVSYVMGVTDMSFSWEEDIDDDEDSITSSDVNDSISDEYNSIYEVFQTALGVSDNEFTLNGSTTECDIIVKAACAAAQATLETMTFSGGFVYVVTNKNTNEEVFSYTHTL